jgi:hypothetical protein
MVTSSRLRGYVEGTHSDAAFERAMSSLLVDLGAQNQSMDPKVLRAIAACVVGALPEDASEYLGWKDFEHFCAALFRARGYSVTENLTLTKPRAQIDLLARSPRLALVVDCKHWARERGPSAMARVALAQAERAKLVRKRMKEVEPMAVVIVVLSNEQTRMTEGAAVVPVRTLSAFLDELPALMGMLNLH